MTHSMEAFMTAWAERDAVIEANRPTIVPPCPSWCRSVELHPQLDHGYEHVTLETIDDDVMTYVRTHESGRHGRDVLDAGAPFLVQEESSRGGVVTRGPILVSAHIDEYSDGMTATDARTFAAGLIAAADQLDEEATR